MEILFGILIGGAVVLFFVGAGIFAFLNDLANIDSPKFSRYDEWRLNRVNKKYNKTKKG